MTDDEILVDRQSKYGPPKLFFKTYGEMCRLLDEYSSSSTQETINDAHLSALKMVHSFGITADPIPVLT